MRQWIRGCAALAVVSLLTAGCGSHLSRQELSAANGSLIDHRTGVGATATRAADADQAGADAATTSDSVVGLDVSIGQGSGANTQTAAAGTTAGDARPGATATAQPGVAARRGVPIATNKPEIVFGSFGAESGVLGAVSGPAPPALRAWVPYINANGGINGHPVRVIQADDGADPARTLSIVRKMVEQDHVVAFITTYSFTTSAAVPYLEQKGVPIIGTIGADAGEDHSSAVFKQEMGNELGNAWGFLLPLDEVQPKDKRKLAILYCREVAICAVQKDQFKELLPYNGLTAVYEAEASLAQPDFTAEVLGARNAGADVIVNLLDSASVIRVAQAVQRQPGYRPVLSGQHNLDQDLLLRGGAALKGAVITSRQPPYHTSPLLKFYRDAMARYQPGATKGSLGAGMFANGKLLAEVVGKALPDGVVTSADMRRALLTTVKDEKLGGLLPGVSFTDVKERPYTNLCVVTMIFDGKTFNPFNRDASFRCPPGWTTGTRPSHPKR